MIFDPASFAVGLGLGFSIGAVIGFAITAYAVSRARQERGQ